MRSKSLRIFWVVGFPVLERESGRELRWIVVRMVAGPATIVDPENWSTQ